MAQTSTVPTHLPFPLLQTIMLPPDTRRGPVVYVLCRSLSLESYLFFSPLLFLLLVMISLVIFFLHPCFASVLPPASHVHFILQIFTARLCVVIQFCSNPLSARV